MAHSSIGAGSKEQRRYARRATLQVARIRFGDEAAIHAEIRDYCQSGLYVAFLGAGTPDAAIRTLVGAAVQIGFGGRDTNRFRLSGRVAHVSPSGAGVFITAMPEEALQTLRKESERLAPRMHDVPQPNLDMQQSQGLQQECTNLFRGFLDAVIADFFQLAAERLSEAGLDELSFLERSRYDYGAQELALRRSRIEEDFFNAVRDRIQNVEPAADDSAVAGKSKLALVDEAEFEDWLNLSAVIKQIESGIAQPLDKFEQRYGRLIGKSINRKNNPFGPEAIGRAFQDATQLLDFSIPMRSALYRVLGQAVSSRAPELYQRLNQVLEAMQPVVPPEPEQDKAHARQPTEADTNADAQTAENDRPKPDLAEIADTLNKLYNQEQTGGGQTAESAEYSLDRILATLNQSQRRAASRAPGTVRAPRQHDASQGQAVARPEVLQVVDRLQQATRQLTGDGTVREAPGMAQAALPEASLRELLVALDGLPLASKQSPGSPVLPPLADQVNASIATAGPQARRLASGHRQILETTSDLFSRAREDIAPSSDMELLVRRLERPLLKLALQDPLFPTMPDHPARQVLNLIEQYAVAADDKGKFFDAKLQRFLYLLVDRVCSRADEDPGIFEMVRDSLEKVLLPILQIRRTRVARLQEASEGRARIRLARTRVNEALEQRLAGREVPGMLLRLLDAGWRQYLCLLELRQGAQGETWETGLSVLDRLSAWCNPSNVDEPRNPAAGQALLGEIERALATVNVDDNLLTAFMDELADRVADCGTSTSTPQAMILVPPGRLSRSTGEGDTAHTASRQLVDRLRVGDWWDFDQDGRRVPMQLIWISQPPHGCSFANRSATNKLELTLAELSRRIQSGLAKPGKDLDVPLIERSENALFDETYQDLMHQVTHDPLTGLLNRKGFMQRLNLLAMPDQEDKAHAVCIIEFDQFRMIYNTCGVEAAEKLAQSLADEVRAQIGPEAAIASFRDDTLAILLPNCSRTEGCHIVDGLLNQVKDYHFQHGQHSYSIGFNIGVTEYAPARFSAVETIRHADSACITAKSLGRNRMQIYEQASPQLQSQESLMDWAGRIDSILNGSGLRLRCQQVAPIAAESFLLPYYEILLGIEGEDGAMINPMHFIPAVERLQRAHEVDTWVLRNVFEWISSNPQDFESVGGFSINLSATSLSSPEVMTYLQTMLPRSNFPTGKITFEITETAAIESYGAAQDFIREIRRYGCKFSLDDFGSGFTSYAHLKNLRTDSLKIDGSFVKDMLNNPSDYAMVKSMNDIGHSLGLRTVAEYVESQEILDALREIGVDYAQGYAIHKPCSIDELLAKQAA